MSARLVAVLVLLACSACNLGQPLVDEREQKPPGLLLPCPMPPKCEEPFMAFDAPDHVARPFAGCASPKFCQLSDWEGGSGACPDDGPVDVLPQTATCQRLKLPLKPDETALSVNDLDWRDVNLELHADNPTTLVLSGGVMEKVYIELHGPIALRLERMQMLSDLRVQGQAAVGGAPGVTLDGFREDGLSIGGEDADFPGSVTFHALQLTDADVRAQRIVIESASIDGANLRANTINVTDLMLRKAKVEASGGLWSAYGVEDSFLTFCGDARLIEGDLSRVGLSSCLESPLHVYASRIGGSTIDGSFELDEVSVGGSRVAMNEPTRVLAFQTRLESTRLCEDVEQFALGHTSKLKCSDCADPAAEQPFCMLKLDPEATFDMENAVDRDNDPLAGNYCKTWKDLEVPACDDSLPTRPERRR